MNEKKPNKETQFNTRKFVTQKEIDRKLEEYLSQFRPKLVSKYKDETLKHTGGKTVCVYEARRGEAL